MARAARKPKAHHVKSNVTPETFLRMTMPKHLIKEIHEIDKTKEMIDQRLDSHRASLMALGHAGTTVGAAIAEGHKKPKKEPKKRGRKSASTEIAAATQTTEKKPRKKRSKAPDLSGLTGFAAYAGAPAYVN